MQLQKLIFVSSHAGTSKKTGQPYNIVTLSNGIRAGVISNPENIDCSIFEEGQEVVAGFEVSLNYSNEWTLKLVSLESE